MDEEIYLEQPEGYIYTKHPDFVNRMYRALFGLKQASRAWYKLCKEVLQAFDCKPSVADQSLFMIYTEGQ